MENVIIIGGGLAGLISAIDLARKDHAVTVIEKGNFPRNKVCGEYISNETLPYLKSLGIDPFAWGALPISRFQFSSPSGRTATCHLPLGGFSITRRKLDFELYQRCLKLGVEVITDTEVTGVNREDNAFIVTTAKQDYCAKLVLGSFGKRSKLDRALDRPFFGERSSFVGIKQYFKAPYADDLVSLHNYEGGYVGVSKVEDGLLNVATLVEQNAFAKFKNPAAFMEYLLESHPVLKSELAGAQPILEKALVISNISFAPKKAVESGVLMIGDAAGMIPPLAGNGMAMAIEAARLSAEIGNRFLNKEIDRLTMESDYERSWNKLFKRRLFWGRQIQKIMGRPMINNMAVRGIGLVPGGLRTVVRLTHGKSKGAVKTD
ncbi:MAG: flavin-dependent dehydrogenase [Flavobacteriales bacterium]